VSNPHDEWMEEARGLTARLHDETVKGFSGPRQQLEDSINEPDSP